MNEYVDHLFVFSNRTEFEVFQHPDEILVKNYNHRNFRLSPDENRLIWGFGDLEPLFPSMSYETSVQLSLACSLLHIKSRVSAARVVYEAFFAVLNLELNIR